MKNRILIPFLLFVASIASANNLQITNVVVNQVTQNVTFDLTWDNSWYVAAAPANWDAAWVFVKWRLCTDGDAIAFTHGTLSGTTAHHTYTNLEAMRTVDGTLITQSVAQGAALDYTDGLMLRPSALALGTITSAVSLRVTNLPASGTDITLSVFGIEMVYIPQGNFKLGDGDGLAIGNAVHRFTDGSLLAGSNLSPSMLVTTAYEIGGATQVFYHNGPTAAPGTTISAVPYAFPKGQFGFYMMKYEITEGLYGEFLNALGYSSAAATARYPANYTTNRNQLNGTIPPYVAGRPDRAQNFLGWADVAAFLDWACLRPMTELEFEKAARGPSASVMGEYAWGSTVISTGVALIFGGAATENGTETTTAGNCVYGNAAATFSNGDAGTGPGRAGLFATASSTRVTAGASYYGVMELSGNLREVVVAMMADAPGAAGSGAGNIFTRTWGDGAISAAGIHQAAGSTANWPVSAVAVIQPSVTNFVGHRGGAWNNAIARITISDREYVYATPVAGRASYNGGRGVR